MFGWFVRDEIARLLRTAYVDEDGERPLQPEDIVVVSPYNGHVRCLRQHLPDQRIRIGTVDKFQGQQAAIVFYSTASSSGDRARERPSNPPASGERLQHLQLDRKGTS